MRLGQYLLRAVSPKDEEQRMSLRKAISMSEAHSQELTNTVILKADDIVQTIKRSLNCSCEDDK